MAFVRNHFITRNGKTFGPYKSLVESFREKGKVKQRYIRYLGRDKSFFLNTPIFDPMRPIDTREIPKDGDYIADRKIDGEYDTLFMTKNGMAIINRRDNIQSERYPELMNIYKKLKFKNILVIAGEVAQMKNGKDDFSDLSGRSHLEDKKLIYMRSKRNPLEYMAFDILYKDGESLINLPLLERKRILDKTVPDDLKRIKEVQFSKNLKKMVSKGRKKDWEGVVFKKSDSEYKQGRSKDWKKYKFLKEADVAIIGYSKGEGKRKDTFGALFMAVFDPTSSHNLRYIGKVGAFKGIDKKKFEELSNMIKKKPTSRIYDIPEKDVTFVEPIFAKIEYLKKGSKGNLREPRFKGLRVDIGVKDTHL